MNLQRPIMLIEPHDAENQPLASMKLERQMLQDNGLLNLSERVPVIDLLDHEDGDCMIVVGYHPDMQGVEKILAFVSHSKLLLIIYTFGKNAQVITPEHQKLFDSYPWHQYANFKMSLLNSIFSTLATFPYGRERS